MDKRQTLIIRYATSADSDRLTDFRISQFKTAKEFELLSPNLLAQQRGHIFIAEQHQDIVSTMQVEFSDFANFQNVCHASFDNDPTLFDTLYLSKGATIKEHRNSGLNSLLRKYTLQAALKNPRVNTLTGVAYENAPRLHLLGRLGYIITETELLTKNFTKPLGKVLFLRLDRPNFLRAIDMLQEETQELREQFEIINQTEPTWSPSYLP